MSNKERHFERSEKSRVLKWGLGVLDDVLPSHARFLPLVEMTFFIAHYSLLIAHCKGKLTINSVPSPTLLATVSVPPWPFVTMS